MLVNRYFGSKEGLFSEVLALLMATTTVVMPEILKKPVSGERIARALIPLQRKRSCCKRQLSWMGNMVPILIRR